MQRRNQPRRLTSEPLEARQVMDGTVGVVVSGNTLKLTGDDQANDLVVTQVGNKLRIEGAPNTNITFNGSTAAFQEVFGLDFSKLDLKVSLKGGIDVVRIGDGAAQTILKSLQVDTGAGVDHVLTSNVAVVGKTSIKMFGAAAENDVDSVTMLGINVFAGDFKLRTGGGADRVFTSARGGLTQFGARSSWDLGAGDDVLGLLSYTANKDVRVQLGEGANTLLSSGGTVSSKLDIRSGKGVDTVTVRSGGTYNKISINLGGGNDTVAADGFTVADIRVNMGKGSDTANGNALNMTKFDLFDGGTGNDTFNFTASNSNIPAAGKLPKSFEVQNIT